MKEFSVIYSCPAAALCYSVASIFFPFQKSSFILQLLRFYCKTFPPIVFQSHGNYCLDIAPCFTEPLFQAPSDCHCFFTPGIMLSSQRWLLWGWSSVRPLLSQVTGCVRMGWPQIQDMDTTRAKHGSQLGTTLTSSGCLTAAHSVDWSAASSYIFYMILCSDYSNYHALTTLILLLWCFVLLNEQNCRGSVPAAQQTVCVCAQCSASLPQSVTMCLCLVSK